MNFDLAKLVVTAAFCFSALILYQRWIAFSEDTTTMLAQQTSQTIKKTAATITASVAGDLPQVTQELRSDNDTTAVPSPSDEVQVTDSEENRPGDVVTSISNDALKLSFDSIGNVVNAKLLRHAIQLNGPPLELLTSTADNLFIGQSGLLGEDLPTHQDAGWQITHTDSDNHSVTVKWHGNGLVVQRTHSIDASGYLGNVMYIVTNNNTTTRKGHAYFQFLRDRNEPADYSSLVPSFFGASTYTKDDKYAKYQFDELEDFPKIVNNGWIAIVQRYFMSAWLDGGGERENYMNSTADNNVAIGILRPLGTIAPGASVTLSQPTFIGALEQNLLEEINPSLGTGIGLAVDYGWLAIICAPLFSVLNFIHDGIGNWGLSIILLTFLIKLLFFPLMSKSYRSMARLKVVAPQMQKLKERHGDDRKSLQQAMMELYRKEKVNPFGGCLPILVQIPVFIALYWMLLESVELRQAPLYLWIQDLSSPDPFYVLPVILGAAMYGQFKLNPTPPDPTQAMVMKIMPLGFAAFSIFFPSGLVVYWITNTALSVAQQWHITRNLVDAKQSKRN